MLNLLILVLIFALICYVIFWAMGYLGVPEPVRKVVTVVIVLIVVIWVLSWFVQPAALHFPLR